MSRWAYLASAALIGFGCSTFSAADDPEPGAPPPDPVDGAAPDSASADGPVADFDGGDGALPEGGELLFDDFESAGGCGDWNGPYVTTTRDETMHHNTGVASCKVCLTGDGDGEISRTITPPGPGTYTLEGFVRDDDRDAGPLNYFEGHIIAIAGDGGEIEEMYGSNAISPTEWRPLQTVLSVEYLPAQLKLKVLGNGVAGQCMYVDNLRLVYAP